MLSSQTSAPMADVPLQDWKSFFEFSHYSTWGPSIKLKVSSADVGKNGTVRKWEILSPRTSEISSASNGCLGISHCHQHLQCLRAPRLNQNSPPPAGTEWISIGRDTEIEFGIPETQYWNLSILLTESKVQGILILFFFYTSPNLDQKAFFKYWQYSESSTMTQFFGIYGELLKSS